MLTIYNSLTRRKEPLRPLASGRIGIYVCGLTVYDHCHLGHARMLITFDVVVRHLRALGLDVNYVRNITDIDDKIIRRAVENDEPFTAVTERFIRSMHEDCAALGVLPPDHEPRATAYIDQIIAMIEELERRELAYRGDNGDVYFAVASFPDYGALSDQRPADLRAGARIEVDESKRDPLDFVLWKAARPNEPSWESPWGPGRPGWHIECSAMSTALLGNHFDIHGGGMDLKFPHHENEIAQSCGAHGGPFVEMWMHNGFVQIDDEKMSKSLGNFFTIRDILGLFRPEEVRFFVLSGHYRSPINYSDKELLSARAALTRLYTALRGLDEDAAPPAEEPYTARFEAAMDDDFNTPVALAALFDLARALNRLRDHDDLVAAGGLGAVLRRLGARIGLLQEPPEVFLTSTVPGRTEAAVADTRIDALIAEREAARTAGDWGRADEIRAELAAAGVVLEDGPGGTTWRRSGKGAI